MLVIDDSNYRQFIQEPAGMSRGRIPRDYSKVPYGAHPYAQPFDLPLIPRTEWAARVQEMEQTKTRLSDILLAAGIPSLDQNGTNYCWCNAVITAMETVRAVMGLPYVKLSAASVAAPVTGYRNVGGWGGEALKYVVSNGVVPADKWPPNAISRTYDTAENNTLRLSYKCTEWYELESRNFAQLATLTLLRIPVPIGLNWWSHEVCGMDLVNLGSNTFGIRIRNSWSDSYGDKGFAVLSESKATPDDAVAPRVATASFPLAA